MNRHFSLNSFSHNNIALLLIGFSSALLGTSMLLMGSHRHIEMTINFYAIADLVSFTTANTVAAFAFLLVAVTALAYIFTPRFKKALIVLLVMVAIVPLGSLLSADMWMKDLGGFPIIGSGQGVIKYFALLSIAGYLLFPTLQKRSQQWLVIFPVLLVLLWIGGMKFFEFEAQGIKPLLDTSPLMSWMYLIWDLQTASNLIGIFDLLAVALLIAAIYKPVFLLPGFLMALSVMLVTQTFLFTLPGSLSSETLLTTTGHFLIKDLWFIANLALFVKVSGLRMSSLKLPGTKP